MKITAQESQPKDKKRSRTSILSKSFNMKLLNYRLLTRSEYSITLSNLKMALSMKKICPTLHLVKNIPVNFMCPASSSKMLKDKNSFFMEVSSKNSPGKVYNSTVTVFKYSHALFSP